MSSSDHNVPSTIRCLVVDDSTIYRKIVRDSLGSLPGVEVVGMARDGVQALEQIEALKPDLVTLDLEMPKLDGIGVLRELADRKQDVATIMVSAFTAEGAQTTTEALSLGAFDFLLKPTTASQELSVSQLRHDLESKIRALRANRSPVVNNNQAATCSVRSTEPTRSLGQPDLIVVGVSTGGPKALSELLPALPGNFPVPILVVQHMPPLFTKSLADDLNHKSALEVLEAENGLTANPGQVLIAPGGKQMRLVSRNPMRVEVNEDPPEKSCRPSVDYLFRSAAALVGSKTLGVILTGMGDDGTLGAKVIHDAGGSIIAQDEPSCVVYGMPKSVIQSGVVDVVAPLDQIAEKLLLCVSEGVTV